MCCFSSSPTGSEKTQNDSYKTEHFCPTFLRNNYSVLAYFMHKITNKKDEIA